MNSPLYLWVINYVRTQLYRPQGVTVALSTNLPTTAPSFPSSHTLFILTTHFTTLSVLTSHTHTHTYSHLRLIYTHHMF